MKTLLTLILVLLFASSGLLAQDMVIVRKFGEPEAIKLIDIDSIYFTEGQPPVYDSVADIDGNVYRTVAIGAQIWMAENLRTSRYNNGDTINTTEDPLKDINPEEDPKYLWAYDGDSSYVPTYGYLYTWYVVNDDRGLCPAGWHVASDDEWTTLETYLGGREVAAGPLKETGYDHWAEPNAGATNSSGFTAIPGGGRVINGVYFLLGTVGGWWTSSEQNPEAGWTRGIGYETGAVNRATNIDKKYGWSVRCVKD